MIHPVPKFNLFWGNISFPDLWAFFILPYFLPYSPLTLISWGWSPRQALHPLAYYLAKLIFIDFLGAYLCLSLDDSYGFLPPASRQHWMLYKNMVRSQYTYVYTYNTYIYICIYTYRYMYSYMYMVSLSCSCTCGETWLASSVCPSLYHPSRLRPRYAWCAQWWQDAQHIHHCTA